MNLLGMYINYICIVMLIKDFMLMLLVYMGMNNDVNVFLFFIIINRIYSMVKYCLFK